MYSNVNSEIQKSTFKSAQTLYLSQYLWTAHGEASCHYDSAYQALSTFIFWMCALFFFTIKVIIFHWIRFVFWFICINLQYFIYWEKELLDHLPICVKYSHNVIMNSMRLIIKVVCLDYIYDRKTCLHFLTHP